MSATNGGAPVETITTHQKYVHDLLKIGQLGTGFDSDEQLGATEEAWGIEAGGAGVARRHAAGGNTPGPLYARHVGEIHEGKLEQEAERERARLAQEAKAAAPRSRHAKAEAEGCRRRIDSLVAKLPQHETERDERRAKLEEVEEQYRRLPRSEQGVVRNHRLPFIIAVSVSLIDVGVLHYAFDSARIDSVTTWMNSFFIPLAILGMIFAFGWLAGLIALAVPPRARIWVGAGTFALALLAVFGGLALLTHFRDAAVVAQNLERARIAAGDTNATLVPLLKTTFLGPLQGAGVCAGIIAEALHVMGGPGRDKRDEVAQATASWKAADEQIAALRRAIDEQERAEGDALLRVEQALVDGAQRAAELENVDALLAAQLKSIRGAVSAAADRYEMERLVADQKARNGDVRLATLKSERINGAWMTPGAQFVSGKPVRETAPPEPEQRDDEPSNGASSP